MPGTIFLVEDDAATRESLTWLLASRDVAVEAFASAEEFLSRSQPHGPGCMLIDLYLPGMSGLDLQAHLAKRGDDRTVIFMTGDLDSPAGRRARTLRPDHCLKKPLRDEDVEKIASALE